MECQDFIYHLVRKMRSQAAAGKRLRGSLKNFPVPADKCPPGRGIDALKRFCIPPGFEPDTQLFQRPESIRQLGDSRTDIEQQRRYWEHTEKIRQKFPAKRNATRFDRSLKNGRPFFLSTFTSVENLAKNMFNFSIECYIAAGDSLIDGYAHLYYSSQISSAQAMETGLVLTEGGSFESNRKVAESAE